MDRPAGGVDEGGWGHVGRQGAGDALGSRHPPTRPHGPCGGAMSGASFSRPPPMPGAAATASSLPALGALRALDGASGATRASGPCFASFQSQAIERWGQAAAPHHGLGSSTPQPSWASTGAAPLSGHKRCWHPHVDQLLTASRTPPAAPLCQPWLHVPPSPPAPPPLQACRPAYAPRACAQPAPVRPWRTQQLCTATRMLRGMQQPSIQASHIASLASGLRAAHAARAAGSHPWPTCSSQGASGREGPGSVAATARPP